ncbi:MAG: metallophosphoesterase [Clostridiaceae bacterium]|nr:metallophosphoesterase [Clostridiaceae bacterium]
MIYVISDLHGYPLEKLKKLLEKANFVEDDFLYILGDVIDRNGDGGVGILEWLLEQPNVALIMGNHEAMLLSCDFIFNEVTETNIDKLNEKQFEILNNYLLNGGGVTLRNLKKLDKQTRFDIVNYLRDSPLYEAVTVGDTDYILVHAGFENFRPDRKLSDYSPDELIWAEPELKDEYFDGIHTVFGHTPTHLFGEEYRGKIVRTRTWTCIDCGAATGNEPVLLRLDDNEEFRLR